MTKTKLFAAGLVGALALTSCRSVQSYDDMLHSWLGQSEAQLVATWGAPVDMQTIAPGRQLFTYIKERQVNVPGEAPNYTALGEDSAYNPYGDSLGETFDYYCKTMFTTQDDIIVGYSWDGDGCLMR